MAAFDEFLVSPPSPGSLDIAPESKLPAVYQPTPIQQDLPQQEHELTNDMAWKQFIEKPASMESRMTPETFDYEGTGAARYVGDRHYKDIGLNPFEAPIEIGGKSYNPNEIRYQQVQTWGDVMKNGVGQFAGLAWNSFKQGFSSDGHLLNALFNWGSDATFKERLMGTPDELLQADKEQKDIMNKYPIFESPATEGVFNKEFMGTMLGQLGFTVGTAGYVAVESLLTAGIADVIAPSVRAAQLAKLGKALKTAGTVAEEAHYTSYIDAVRKGTATGEMINDIRKVTDVAKDRNFMQGVYNHVKNAIPGIEGYGEYKMAKVAGATAAEAISAGLPGMVKSWTMFGAARAEATMEAASTYGQLYTALQDDYEKKHGYAPQGEDLEHIRTAAYGAATDNYIVNTGMLSVMNELEFGNMVSKFSSTKRMFTDAATAAGKDMYAVTAKDATGTVISKAYKSGRLGALGNLGSMRKDFGLGTALWQISKKAVSEQTAKFEFMEGLQEILQNSSDETLRTYYTNLYNGNKDLNGGFLKDITSADWSKGLATQLNQEGWKTFLMGATTGLFLSPISGLGMYARNKGTAALNTRYRDQLNANEKLRDDNVTLLNEFYKNCKDNPLLILGNIKTQMQTAKNMQGALPDNDKYTFYNSHDDAITNAANTALRTGTMENFLQTLGSMADGRLSDAEFSQAIGSAEPVNAKEKIQELTQEIGQYYTNYQNLMDRYSDLIIPEIHSDPQQYQLAQEQRTALHEAISILATTDYHAQQAIKRAQQIKTEMSKLPDIGMSAAHTFDIIGSRATTDKEIGLLQDQIKTYEALGTSKDAAGKDITQILHNNKVQLEVLQKWAEHYDKFSEEKSVPQTVDSQEHKDRVKRLDNMKNLFSTYIRTQNIISGIGPAVIDDRQVEKAFSGLGDYIALNRDHGHYIEALNVLTNPKNLKTLWYRILKAQKEAVDTVSGEAKQEAKDRTDATVGGTQTEGQEGTQEEPETATEEKPVEDTDKQAEYENDRATILKSHNNTTADKYPELLQKIENIDNYYPEHERKQATEDAINDQFDKLVNPKTKKEDYPNLNNHPHIAETGDEKTGIKYYAAINKKDGSKKVQIGGEDVQTHGTIRGANRDLQKYVDQKHPYVIGQEEFRVGQTVYSDDGTPYYIGQWGVDSGHTGYYIQKDSKGKYISITPDELLENYNTAPTEQPTQTTPEATTTPYDSTQPKSSKPYAIVNVAPNNNSDTYLTEQILNIPEESNTTGAGYSIVVKKNKEVADSVNPIEGNTQIVQKGQQYSIQLQHNGTVVGYITNPSPQIYRAPDGTEKTVQQLTLADITALYQMTPQMRTAEMWQNKLREQDNNGAALQKLIDEAVGKKGGKLSIEGKLMLTPHYQYDWIKTGETGAKLADIQGIQKSTGGVKMYVVDNNPEHDIPYVQSTMSETEEEVAKSIRPVGQLSMYTAVVRLDNGKYVPIQLTPRKLSVTEGQDLVQAISGIENNQQLIDANEQLKKLFITLPVYNEEHIDNKGIMISVRSVGLGKDNHLVVAVNQRVGDQVVKLGETKNIQGSISNTKELVEKLNIALQANEDADIARITESNLRWQPVRENIGDIEASVHANLFKSISLTYAVPDTKGEGRIEESKPGIQQTAPEVVTPEMQAARDKILSEQPGSPVQKAKRATKLDQKRKVTKPVDNIVPKITEYNTFSASDIESVEKFGEFMKDNLPDWVTVGELDDVIANMQATHTTVGQMVTYINELGNVAGRIETKAGNPYKYHEAFHAIYRLLLNPEQQQRLLDTIAEPTQSQLDKLQESHSRYTGMGKEQMVKEWKEEHMADEFDRYSMDRSKSQSGNLIKTLFNKLIDWIKWVKDVLTGNRLRALAYKVHTGDYKTAGLQQNMFTENVTINSPVPKAIQIGEPVTTAVKLDDGSTKEVTVPRHLDSTVASRLTTDITAQVILEMGQQKHPSYDTAVEDILNRYQQAYDPHSQRNQDILGSIDNDIAAEEWDDKLTDVYLALEKGEGREILKENIQENLRLQGVRQSLIDQEADDIDEYIGRAFADKSSIGGYNVVDKDLRTYMSSANMEYTPIVQGIATFEDNTPMIQAVDTNVVYNGMLKILSQSVDQHTTIENILAYRDSGNNPDATAFINKWLAESGFNVDKFQTEGIAECANEAGLNLFNKALKQLGQVYNDYISVLEDTNTKKVSIVDAGRNSSERSQYTEWSNTFYQNYYKHIEADARTRQKSKLSEDRYKDAVEPINDLLKHTYTKAAKGREIDDNTLAEVSKSISDNLMSGLGINIHPNYINYSIVWYKEADVRRAMQRKMLLTYPTAKPINIEGLKNTLIPILKDYRNPFNKPEGQVKKTAQESLLMSIAKNNTLFDSTVDSMSHVNNRGDSVYNFGYGSYNTVTVKRLNNPEYIAGLQANPDTQSSWLLSEEKFLSMIKTMFSAGGISLKGTYEDIDEETGEKSTKVVSEQRSKSGVDFSGFNDREYDAYNLALYDISTNPDARHVDAKGKVWYTVPISLGTIAEKNTHHAVYVPVIYAVKEKEGKIGITSEVKEILYSEVETECKRIQKVAAEIEQGREAIIANGGEWIDEYHDGAQRGLKLFTIRELLGTELSEKLEANPESVEDHIAEIDKVIEKNLLAQVQDKRQQMIEEGLITSDDKNILAPDYLFKGIGIEFDGELNLQKGKFMYNLSQKYINDYVGYIGISRILYGDKSKSSKSVEDWWKRMAGFNGQGMDISTAVGTPEIAPVDTLKLVLYPEDKFTTKQGDTAVANDGQAEVTAKGYKQFLIARGKLSELEQTILIKTDNGKELSVQEFSDMWEYGVGLNSLKPVYRDAETYLKCSITLLNRIDTSYRGEDGEWLPIPGRELLHNRLNEAEQQEEDGNIVIIGNKSISKSKTANLVKQGDNIQQMHTDIAANDMRVQTETPLTGDTGNKSTQPDKQILASQDPNAMVYYEGKYQKAGKVIQAYMDAGEQRVLNNAVQAVGSMFSPVESISDAELKGVTFDEGKFQDSTIDTLIATGKDSQTIEMWTTVGGVAQYDINLPNMVEAASSTFLSKMIRRVTKEQVPMWKMILRSDTGMSVIRKVTALTEDGQPKMWEIVTMDEYKRKPVFYKSLNSDDRFTELHIGDVVVDRLRDNIPQYSADGKKVLYYYTEGLRPYMSVDEKVNGKLSEELSQCMGARTPGTGFQSYRRVHWVDRLSDVLTNTAIISRDAMVSTGHDYDVDSLFCAIPATYTSNGRRVLYGTATTDQGKFNEYIRYQVEYNKELQRQLVSDKIDTSEEAIAMLLGTYSKGDRILDTMKGMKLPSTVQEFMKRGGDKLNNGVLNNKGLQAQMALLSGEHVSGGGKDALISRPTSTAGIETMVQNLAAELTTGEYGKEAQKVADRLTGTLGDMNGLTGQLNAYKAMQQGGEGIGSVANILQTTAVLNQFDKKLRAHPYKFDNKVYNEYRGNKNSTLRVRDEAADILAQIHVDATKNQLPSKLAITAEYAGILTHMVKLGQTLDNAILYPQTKPWIEYAKRTAYGRRTFKPLEKSQSDEQVLGSMIGGLKNRGAVIVPLSRQAIIDYIKGDSKNINVELSLLNDLKTMVLNTEPLKMMSRFMRFDTGRLLGTWEEIDHVKQGLAELGMDMKEEEFTKSSIPVDVRDIIRKKHGNMSANYKVLKAIDMLGKKVFIERSDAFRDIQDSVLDNMEIPEWDRQFSKTLKHDIISYLSLTAYMKTLKDDNKQEVLDSLNNGLIWDNPENPNSIISIVQNLRGQLKGKNINYALNSFLNTVIQGSKKGVAINEVVANTWTRMSNQQQEKVVGAIVDLVANRKGDIHKGGIALFNYLLVKDGGQFKSGSFIRFIPPFMMKDWSDSMTKVVDVLSGKIGKNTYKNTFGVDKQVLIDKFTNAYTTHIDSQRYLINGQGMISDGDSHQWKGAKAVFGEYPTVTTSDRGEILPKGYTQISDTEATKALSQEYGVLSITNGTDKMFTKNGKRVGEGYSPNQLLNMLRGNSSKSAQPVVPSQQMNTRMGVIPLTSNFSRQSVIADPTHLYLFTDNANRSSGSNRIASDTTYAKRYGQGTYPGMTQAVIRGLENAYPITTMVDDKRTQWTDGKFNEYKKIIDSEVEYIKEAMASGQYKGIKFAAQMPFGKGQISNMRQSAPKIWQYMNEKLKEIGIDNTGEKPTVNIPTDEEVAQKLKDCNIK